MKKILVVDDHSEIRKLIRYTLANRYEVLEAQDADTAEGLLRAHKPDAVLLDVMMPGSRDGFRFCADIKADPELRATYVMLITARGQESDIARGQAAGAEDYFIKPFSPLELLRRLRDSVGE